MSLSHLQHWDVCQNLHGPGEGLLAASGEATAATTLSFLGSTLGHQLPFGLLVHLLYLLRPIRRPPLHPPLAPQLYRVLHNRNLTSAMPIGHTAHRCTRPLLRSSIDFCTAAI